MKQLNLFDWIDGLYQHDNEAIDYVGQYLEDIGRFKRGKPLKFQDIHDGQVVIVDKSTQNHVWSEIVIIEKVFKDIDARVTYKESKTGKSLSMVRKYWIDEEDLFFKVIG